jgi:predicted dienelactone hydrolase
VGVLQRHFLPDKVYDWRKAATHELLTTIWYPAEHSSVEQPQWIGPPSAPLFSQGNAAPDAKLAGMPSKFPLIVISHGTGGSAAMMAWLGTVLAQHGYIAAAVNHPGNNGTEEYTVEGFVFWWERATDLSVVIDNILQDSTFGPHIDPKRIGAAGFSLGAYTVIEIAGGITVPANYDRFCKSNPSDPLCKDPPEFPNLRAKADQYANVPQNAVSFKDAYEHASDSRRDPRVRAVFAVAPVLAPVFDPNSLEKISIPVKMVVGDADPIAVPGTNAKFFAAHIPGAKLAVLSGGVAHYTYLDTCTEAARKIRPALCADAPGVNRDAVHNKTAEIAVSFFDANLR